MRNELFRQLRPIAATAREWFDDAPPVRWFDGMLDGPVVMSEAVAAGYPRAEPVLETAVRGRYAGVGTWPRQVQSHVVGPLYRADHACLHGLAMQLDNGYGGDDVLSLVFASLPADKTPFPRLIQALGPGEWAPGSSEDAAEPSNAWCLISPGIHLRYRFEEWVNRLLAAVKYFFVPDLTWWAHEDEPGYAALAAQWDAIGPAFSRADVVFDVLRVEMTRRR